MKKNVMPEMLFFAEYGDSGIHVTQKVLKDYKRHSHDFYEFEYIIDGEGVCEINHQKYPIRKGDVSFVTPLDVHGYQCRQDFKVLTVHFRTDHLSQQLLYINAIEACVVQCSQPLKEVFELLVNADAKEEFYELFCEKALELIVIRFLQMLNGERSKDKPNEIRQAVEYMNLYFRNSISLKTVSEHVGYSPEHFSRQFKKYTGKNFIKYLNDLRLTYAKNLLMMQGVSVTQVCYECGFGCLRNFNRAFKAKYGCSPQYYKNQKMSEISQN